MRRLRRLPTAACRPPPKWRQFELNLLRSGEIISWRPSGVSDQPSDVSRLLAKWRQGDREALERLMPLVYGELRKLAAYHLRAFRGVHKKHLAS